MYVGWVSLGMLDREEYVGAGWSMLSKVSVQGVWKVVLMLWVGKEGTDSFLP